MPVAGFSALPLRVRARALGLALLQAGLGKVPAERAAALLPTSVRRALGRLAAPLRVPQTRPRAFIDVAAAILELGERGARIEEAASPRVSIVVPTAGSTEWLRLGLLALAAHTRPESYEVVVVDDASPDPAEVRRVVARHPGVVLQRSDTSRGFAASVNAGVSACRGSLLVILNDDVLVTPGWLDALSARLDADPRAAWVGPACNDTGDEASVPAEYDGLSQLLRFAAGARGEPREVDKLALHCALLRRASFQAVGGLDEGYQRGMFEDDDLCMALRARGERVLLSPETYVHHAAGATLRALSPRTYFECFEVNRRRFERRWQVRWRVRQGH